MCLRLILCTVLLVSVTIILSSSSSEHRLRRRSHSWKACEPFKLPSNAEWIRRWYNKRCKGLFVCCEGYELVVKTVCNKRGRWKVKTFCVPRVTTKTSPTSSTTTSTTSPTTSSSTSSPSTTLSTTPSTTSTTSSTTSDSGVMCDSNVMVVNGVITSEISTEVGSVVQFNCSSGFTLNGRVGTLTCNDMGDFEQDLVCEDCRVKDEGVLLVSFDNEQVAEDESQCELLCNDEPDCVNSQFTAPNACIFNFTLTEFNVPVGSVELCRQTCYDNSRCKAFLAPTSFVQDFPFLCSLFTRNLTSFFPSENKLIFSTCI